MDAPSSPRRPDRHDESWVWLEQRYREHRRQLYRFALGVLGNKEDAEDATQITLLSAYDALARGKRPTWPRAWLFAITLNACRRVLRRRAQGLPAGDVGELRSLVDADDLTGAAISRAVASLPPEQREVFILRELRGLSYAELSERLGLSPAAVESRLVRARRRLRKQLVGPEGSLEGRPSRRRPLLGVADALAAVRVVPGSAVVKLAAVVGAGAIAPVVATTLPVVPEGSTPAIPRATVVAPIAQPIVRVPVAPRRPAAARVPRAWPMSGKTPRRPKATPAQPARPATVQVAATGSSPAAPASEPSLGEAQPGVAEHPLGQRPAREPSPRPRAQDGSVPEPSVPKPSVPDVVEQVAAAAQDTADDSSTVVPTPTVPSPSLPDPVPVDVPDPAGAAEDVVDTTSSAVPEALPGLG